MNSLKKNLIKNNVLFMYKKTENNLFAPWGLLFGNQQGYNLQNQYQPLFSANDNCFKNIEGLVKENKVIVQKP